MAQLLIAAVFVEFQQYVAVCLSSDQPEIEHVLGRHDSSSIPTARNHMDSGQGILQAKDLETIWR